jgi:hypothetical protein
LNTLTIPIYENQVQIALVLQDNLFKIVRFSSGSIIELIWICLLFINMSHAGLYFKQLLMGRDVAISPSSPVHHMTFPFAKQMRNFAYLIGDTQTRKCIVVDPCWDVKGLHNYAKKDNMTITGAMLTV